jgi:hypothetical protein
MKYTVSTSGNFYTKEKAENLRELGFQFEPTDYNKYDFTISGKGEVEINSLEDLNEFVNKYGEVIYSESYLEIYDDYRE